MSEQGIAVPAWERMDVYLQATDLSATMRQAVAARQKDGLGEAVDLLEDVTRSFIGVAANQDGGVLLAKLDALRALKDEAHAGNKRRVEEFADQCEALLLRALVNERFPELGEEQALAFDDALVRTDTDAPVLALASLWLALATGRTMPAFSYDSMLRAFQLEPQLLELAYERHHAASYVYQGGGDAILPACPVCGSEERTPHFNAPAYSIADFSAPFSPAKLWMRCHRCGNLHSYNFPAQYLHAPDDSRTIHPRENVYLTAQPYFQLDLLGAVLDNIARFASGNRLLEVGIGQGDLLAKALEYGYDVCAVEIEEPLAQRAADLLGIDVHCGDFLHYETDRRFDVITMGDVIEHIFDPARALKKAHELLAAGGTLWLSTPNFDSAYSRLMKFDDGMWSETGHVTYFNRAGLTALLESTGFAVKDYRTSERYNGAMEIVAIRKP